MDEDENNGDITQGQDDVTQIDTGTSNEETTDTGGHPAWKEILDQLPDEFHPLITPKLEAWDSGVQTRFQNLQQQYEPFKPFVEQEVDPEFIEQSLQLAAAIEQDPERVYKALAEAYGYSQGVADTTEATDDDLDDTDDDDPVAARLAEHERMLERMAEAFMADQDVRAEQESSDVLDEYMEALKDAYPDGFDETYVLTAMANGTDGEVAVQQFQSMITQYGGSVQQSQSSTPAAPPILGSGGGMPSQQVDPRTLSTADTERVVAEMLRAANEE